MGKNKKCTKVYINNDGKPRQTWHLDLNFCRVSMLRVGHVFLPRFYVPWIRIGQVNNQVNQSITSSHHHVECMFSIVLYVQYVLFSNNDVTLTLVTKTRWYYCADAHSRGSEGQIVGIILVRSWFVPLRTGYYLPSDDTSLSSCYSCIPYAVLNSSIL